MQISLLWSYTGGAVYDQKHLFNYWLTDLNEYVSENMNIFRSDVHKCMPVFWARYAGGYSAHLFLIEASATSQTVLVLQELLWSKCQSF